MGQVNLYKIDKNKQIEFRENLCNKFEFIGEQNYFSISNKDTVFTVGTYICVSEKKEYSRVAVDIR